MTHMATAENTKSRCGDTTSATVLLLASAASLLRGGTPSSWVRVRYLTLGLLSSKSHPMGLSSGMPGMELFPSGNSHTVPLMLVPVEEFLLEFTITEVRAQNGLLYMHE